MVVFNQQSDCKHETDM